MNRSLSTAALALAVASSASGGGAERVCVNGIVPVREQWLPQALPLRWIVVGVTEAGGQPCTGAASIESFIPGVAATFSAFDQGCFLSSWTNSLPIPNPPVPDVRSYLLAGGNPDLVPVLGSLVRAARTWNAAAVDVSMPPAAPSLIDVSTFEFTEPSPASIAQGAFDTFNVAAGTNPVSSVDGINMVTFGGVSSAPGQLVLGITSVTIAAPSSSPCAPNSSIYASIPPAWLPAPDGTILDADVVLNGAISWAEFNPYIQNWLVTQPGAAVHFSIEGVAAHEFGHVMGLAHSLIDGDSDPSLSAPGVPANQHFSTMFPLSQASAFAPGAVNGFTTPVNPAPWCCPFNSGGALPLISASRLEGASAATLEADDRCALADAYPPVNVASTLGVVTGYVHTGGGPQHPVKDAHVVAFRRSDPALTRAGAITDHTGRYEIRGLPPGDYDLQAEPIVPIYLAPNHADPLGLSSFALPNYLLPPALCGCLSGLLTDFDAELWNSGNEAYVEILLQETTPTQVATGSPGNRDFVVGSSQHPRLTIRDLAANGFGFPHGMLVQRTGNPPAYPSVRLFLRDGPGNPSLPPQEHQTRGFVLFNAVLGHSAFQSQLVQLAGSYVVRPMQHANSSVLYDFFLDLPASSFGTGIFAPNTNVYAQGLLQLQASTDLRVSNLIRLYVVN